ncbi:FecR family protein [Chitinophaga sp. GbtcB8]|uniref:FecR family protein n=1 Tax=Chitinophaga sp. GbtcB8 TaxID=2824753 RepID=UPI001C30ED94|nr:FecR family protein [Chitinophaga sp. GbtcB8]
MPQETSRITYLLQRYISKTCTRQELEELLAYIAAHPDDAALQHFMETAYRGLPADAALPEVDLDHVYHNIISPAPAKRIFPIRYAAAAAIIAGAITLALLWRSPGPSTQTNIPIAQQTINNITPGANKAVLTLADGTTITLDSSGRQVISGNTHITQQNGQLVYGANGTDNRLQYHTLSTPRGGQFKLTLPDGTKVWLNSASSLRYPTAFTGKNRIVELQGQGYFEVAQQANQPFKVMVNSMEVQVLGTSFDVMAYGDEATVNTTLVAGSVQVKEGNALRLLLPGQQAVLDHENHALTVQAADVQKIIAWKNGLFVFNNMTLAAILREVARWYDVDIVYTVTPSAELYGGGISRNLQLGGVLNLLEASGFNHFKVEGRKIIVLP